MSYEPQYRCEACKDPLRYSGLCRSCYSSGLFFGAHRNPTMVLTPCCNCKRNTVCIRGFCCRCYPHPVSPDREPSRHCSACGIGTCDYGKSECGRCKKPEPVTLDSAAALFNKIEYAGINNWTAYHSSLGKSMVAGRRTHPFWDREKPFDLMFSEFEAIAIAEKYLREGK
jgi:hypothetical protein